MGGLMTAARGTGTTEAARAAFLSKFEREVDPDGTLSPDERSRRAAAARRLHFTRLALASSRARGKKKPAPRVMTVSGLEAGGRDTEPRSAA
jgi:hypothetical protein